MKTRKTDENGDCIVENGFVVYLYGIDAVMQTCEQVMKQQLKELQYDQTKGIEYFNNVFSGTPNLQLFESQSRTQLRNVSGVTGISSFTYKQVDDQLSYTAIIKTTFGTDEINGAI